MGHLIINLVLVGEIIRLEFTSRAKMSQLTSRILGLLDFIELLLLGVF